MQKIEKIKIDKELYCKVLNLFPNWKNLNYEIKKVYSRGVNFHEAFSEIIVGFHYGLSLEGNNSSADLVSEKTGKKYQVKGSSYYKKDLSSFGPKSSFDYLIYCGLDEKKEILLIWEIDIIFLKSVMVNKSLTFEQRQQEGKRPRFSIYNQIIKKNSLKPKMEVNLHDEKKENNC